MFAKKPEVFFHAGAAASSLSSGSLSLPLGRSWPPAPRRRPLSPSLLSPSPLSPPFPSSSPSPPPALRHCRPLPRDPDPARGAARRERRRSWRDLRWPGGSRAARPLAAANAGFDARAALEREHRAEKCMVVGAVEADACTILDFSSPNFPSLLFDASNQRRCCQSICSTFPITDTSFFPSMAAHVLHLSLCSPSQ